MPQDLKDRVAVVTGASSGIGAATARSLAAAGAPVALLARRRDRVEDVAKEIESAGGRALAVEADVTDRASIEAAAERIRSELGRPAILVNNAGQMLNSPVEAGRTDDWRAMLDINLMGVFDTTDVFLQDLIAENGDIVSLSSVAGRVPMPGAAAYNATKYGITGWSDALRKELAGRARVIVIEPGVVDTELISIIGHDETRKSLEEFAASVDALAAEDIAETIAFAVTRPARMAINEVLIRPRDQDL